MLRGALVFGRAKLYYIVARALHYYIGRRFPGRERALAAALCKKFARRFGAQCVTAVKKSRRSGTFVRSYWYCS